MVVLMTALFCKSAVASGKNIKENDEKAKKAFSLIENGKFNEGAKIFYNMAQSGDAKAMTTLGSIYYKVKEYDAAIAWFLSAMKKKDSDSYNNVGVMYRDGLGVKKNRKIAYALFLYTHMMSLGNESTQMRANRNLRREVRELPKKDIRESLCYTWAYILQYAYSKGEMESIPKKVLPKKGDPLRTRLKDAKWWLSSEKRNFNFSCPKPWN